MHIIYLLACFLFSKNFNIHGSFFTLLIEKFSLEFVRLDRKKLLRLVGTKTKGSHWPKME